MPINTVSASSSSARLTASRGTWFVDLPREPDDAALAVRLARKAVEWEPEQSAYWNTLGLAHYRAGDWWPPPPP